MRAGDEEAVDISGAPQGPPLPKTPLDVTRLLQRRWRERGLTLKAVAAILGYSQDRSVGNFFRGRVRLSKSKHFTTLADLLGLTQDERDAIERVESRRT